MGKSSNPVGKVWGGEFRQEKFREKKRKRHQLHTKMNTCRKFLPNRTIGKCSKSGRNVWREGGIYKKKKKNGRQKCRHKMNLCDKFHPNRTKEKCLIKFRGKIGDKLMWETALQLKKPSSRLHNIFFLRTISTRFEINFVVQWISRRIRNLSNLGY